MDHYLNVLEKEITIVTERESVYYDTKFRTHKKKELVNSTENIALASSNMGGVGWRLMIQNTGKISHFNI